MAANQEPNDNISLKIGILAIQGAFFEHHACLLKAKEQIDVESREFGLDVVEVKRADHLEGIDGLIIPGGESTVMGKSLEKDGFGDAIKSWMDRIPKPVVWGTCAGMILLAKNLQQTKTGGQYYVRRFCVLDI